MTIYPAGQEPPAARVAGVDLGIIHPYAVAGPGGQGLLVSGRAIRAEHRMHLADRKTRARAAARRAPKPGQRGSRRWRHYRRRQRLAEARVSALKNKAEAAGISLTLVDERGTSSTCPACASRIPKPAGRVLVCPACQFTGHRDLSAAASIAARSGGGITPVIPVGVTHRRAGAHLPGVAPSRRDPRRRAHHRGARGSPGRHRPARASPI